jgi:hypothetical protein
MHAVRLVVMLRVLLLPLTRVIARRRLPAMVSLLVLTCPILSLAQADFRPGYIVSLTGDTLRGELTYSGAQRSALVCRFRPAPTAPATSYNAGQLRGYGFPGNKVYEARALSRPDSSGYVLPPRPVFLEVLTAGPVTLYYYQNLKAQEQFYVATSASGPVQELVHTSEVVSASVNNYYRENNRFRGTLAEVFAACPSVQQSVASLPFKLSALVAIVQRYNRCVQPATTSAPVAEAAAVARRRGRLTAGLLLGGQLSQQVLQDDDSPVAGTITGSIAPAGGLGLQLSLPALNDRLALRLEALYEWQKYDGIIGNNTFYTYNDAQVRVGASYLRVPLLLRYIFPTRRVQPFLQAGLAYNRLLSHEQEYQFRFALSNGSMGYAPPQPLTLTVRNDELSFIGALGAQLPNVGHRTLALEARAERGSGMFATATSNNYVMHYYLLLGYSLSKTN